MYLTTLHVLLYSSIFRNFFKFDFLPNKEQIGKTKFRQLWGIGQAPIGFWSQCCILQRLGLVSFSLLFQIFQQKNYVQLYIFYCKVHEILNMFIKNV